MNAAIEHARNVALDLLKPSASQLEHGLELHSQVLVAESYGLGLHAPVVPEESNALLDENASSTELRDLHEEHGMLGWLRTAELRREYREAWEAAGVSCIFLNAGEEGNQPTRLLKRLARYVHLIDSMPELLARAHDVDGIEAAFKAGKRTIYLTGNGIPLVGDQQTPEEELGLVRVFAQLGVRMMHLTYNRRNPMGDGCGEPTDGGLSDFGQAAIREMNRLGVIVDLAHTGWQTCLDAARVSTRPVVVSHSVADAINHHIRAKPDEVIRAVVDTGGTIGVTNVPAFLGGCGDITAFLDHIDYLVKTFGADAVTIGTDRAYRSIAAPAASEKARFRLKTRARWESLWPPKDPLLHEHLWSQPRQVESLAWTNWPLFTVGMVQRGHSDETIAKVVGGNILRVARANWSGSALDHSSSLG
ncbi:MAG TPA: membrane dipeptidase [Chthoniobacteraceae bacterium]|nr:membrane dipeptidase [Chthoniobacteraceae bacterium]